MLEALPRSGHLLAAGGGAVLDSEVRAALRRFGRVVWLHAPAAVLAARVRGSDRPSLTGADPADELAQVLASREALYRGCADEVVDCAGRVEEVTRVIEQLWSLLPHHQLR